MKTLKAIFTAATLALALSIPASAGDITTPGIACPGDIGTSAATAPEPGVLQGPGVASTAPGDIGSPGFADILVAMLSMF